MGNCTSAHASELSDGPYINNEATPFVRQEGSQRATCMMDNEHIQDLPGFFPPREAKELVLKNQRCEHTKESIDDIQTGLDKKENIQLIDEEDHYVSINEVEMIPTSFFEKAEEENLEYSEMVKIFKPLIVHNLLVYDILPSLPFLENHDDIYAEMKNHSPKNAVVCLLDELERSKELGKWQKFIDALVANGYTYIADNIRGYRFISHKYQREYIKKLTPKIGRMIVTRELLPYLLAKDLISDNDKENIQREDINHGNFAAACLLLDRIHRKHRNWYQLLIEALKEASMDDVAVDLQIPHLLENKRTKVTDVCYGDDDTYYHIPPRRYEGSLKPGSYMFPGKDSDENVFQCKKTKPSVKRRLPPPLPPIPWRKSEERRKMSLPVGRYFEYEDIYSFAERRDDQVYDDKVDLNEMYEDYSIKRGDNRHSTKSSKACLSINDYAAFGNEYVDSSKCKSLHDEMMNMRKQHHDLNDKITHLEQKSSFYEDMIVALRREDSLKRNNTPTEKEKQTLQLDITPEDDTGVNVDNTFTYYPTANGNKTDEQHRGTVFPTPNFWKNQTFAQMEPDQFLLQNSKVGMHFPANVESPLSVVQVYSPAYKCRKTMSQDSGIDFDFSLNFA